MDKVGDLEKVHERIVSRNSVFRQNKAVHDYFSANADARRFFMLNGIAHQTFFVIALLVICGFLVNNQVVLYIILEQENNQLGMLLLVFAFFCLFCIFCTRSLRYDGLTQARPTDELPHFP